MKKSDDVVDPASARHPARLRPIYRTRRRLGCPRHRSRGQLWRDLRARPRLGVGDEAGPRCKQSLDAWRAHVRAPHPLSSVRTRDSPSEPRVSVAGVTVCILIERRNPVMCTQTARRVRRGPIGAARCDRHPLGRNAVASSPSQSSVHVGIIEVPTGRRAEELARLAAVECNFSQIHNQPVTFLVYLFGVPASRLFHVLRPSLAWNFQPKRFLIWRITV